MESWPWWALGFSFVGAGIIGFNQHYKVDGRALVIGRVLGVLPFALLAFVLLPWPHEIRFYLAAAVMGLVLMLADVLLFNAAAVYGGRLASLYVPLKMYMAFILWGVLAGNWPALAWQWGVVLLCFAVSGGALLMMRKGDASWQAIRAIVPIAALFALGDVVAKAVLPPVDGGLPAIVGGVAAYLLISNIAAALFGLLRGRVVLNKRDLIVATVFGSVLYVGVGVLLVTIALAPNPGYVGAITMLSSVWLALWAYFRRGERNNFGACLALATSAMVLAWAVS